MMQLSTRPTRAVNLAIALDGPDDITLLDRWRSGDNEAGETLFGRHFDSIFGFFETKCEAPQSDDEPARRCHVSARCHRRDPDRMSQAPVVRDALW